MKRTSRTSRTLPQLTILLGCGVLASCNAPGGGAPPSTTPPPAPSTASPALTAPAALMNTAWRLAELQSMDDEQGTTKPADAAQYTMRLKGDGTVAMTLNCNQATGTWTATPGADATSGQFEFGPLASTRALCPPPSLDERVAKQAQYVRSYLMKDGRLYLSLMADGGIQAWEPLMEVSFETKPDEKLEEAIRSASPSYTKEVVEAGGPSSAGRYVYGRVDLNGDGKEEVFAYLLGSFFCGSGGCNLLLFTEGTNGYALVKEFAISRLPIIVSAEKTNGWSDLFRPESGGGAKPSYVRHAYDGKTYVERERLPAEPAPTGRRYLAGDLDFEKATPIAPRP